MSQSISDFISSTDEKTRPIVKTLRATARAVFPEASEFIYHGALGYSLTGKIGGRFIYIAPGKEYANLGFAYGKDLEVLSPLIEGTGKRMRHIKVRTREEALNPALKDLIVAAYAHEKQRVR